MKIAVVGGGAVGLTTALELQKELRNAEISVFASDFNKTVSHVAPGIFRIGSAYAGPTEAITKNWVQDSFEYYDNIRRTQDSSVAGVTSISGYMFANSSPERVKSQWMEGLVPEFRRVTDDEFNLVGGNWKYGSFVSTLLTECGVYLPWARKKLEGSGVNLITRKVDSLAEFNRDWDVIMNCTGFGSRYLCKDKRMIPISGQVLKVKAPWIKTFFYGEINTFVIPGLNDTITLGGSRNFDSQDTTLCPYDAAAIRERCENLVPSLKKAELLRREVGVRPYREGNVRVEAERVENGSVKAILVHNYGHGGYGVCTAPGTAKYAIQLAKDFHRSSMAKL